MRDNEVIERLDEIIKELKSVRDSIVRTESVVNEIAILKAELKEMRKREENS